MGGGLNCNLSYFPYDRQNGTRSSNSNVKDKGFEYHFLVITTWEI